MKVPRIRTNINRIYNCQLYLEYLSSVLNRNPAAKTEHPLYEDVREYERITFSSRSRQMGQKFFLWSVFQQYLSECEDLAALRDVYRAGMVKYADELIHLLDHVASNGFAPIWEMRAPLLKRQAKAIERLLSNDVLLEIGATTLTDWPDELLVNLVLATPEGTSYGYPLTILILEESLDPYLLETMIHEILHFIDLTESRPDSIFHRINRALSARKIPGLYYWLLKHAWIYFYAGWFMTEFLGYREFLPAYVRGSQKCRIESMILDHLVRVIDGDDVREHRTDSIVEALAEVGSRVTLAVREVS